MRNCAFCPVTYTPFHQFRSNRLRLCTQTSLLRPVSLFSLRASLDPYKELGVSPSSDDATIKRAYRKAALERHPDVSTALDARDRFQRAQDAYRMLSDPSSRAAYDRAARRSSSGTYSGSSSTMNGDGGAAAREYARKWRQANPMPEDLDDDLGSVLRDLFGGAVRGAKEKGPSVLNDVLDLLERNVGIGGGSATDSENRNEASVLNSKSVDVLEAEIRECERAMEAADVRARGAENEISSLRGRIKDWERRSATAVDYGARLAAKEMVREIEAQLSRLEVRVTKFREARSAANNHRELLTDRLTQVREGRVEVEVEPTRTTKETASRTKNREEKVDEELEAMKRELGLDT